MANNPSEISSSVAPGDSASSTGRKNKPGKRERQAARSAVGSSGGVPASTPKAQAFARGTFEPVPQPGRFPVVFQAGVGEPTRDTEFVLDHKSLVPVVESIPSRYSYNPKYVEFLSYTGLDDSDFYRQLSVAFFLRLSQQLVHAHVNIGLPQGDFASVASSDVKIPSGMDAIVRQWGEFLSPTLGTRYLLSDYANTISHLVFTAYKLSRNGQRAAEIVSRFWLPMSPRDRQTKVAVANGLNALIARHGISILPGVLEDAVLSGDVPQQWEDVKNVLGPAPGEGETDIRDRFDFVFKSYANVGLFTTAWTTVAATAALAELDLAWPNPSAGHLDWSFNPKTTFSALADDWARKSAAYAQFFELTSGLPNRQAACGTHAQLSLVQDLGGVVVISAFLALSAPEFSLAACFPPTVTVVGGVVRKVVLTTSVNVAQRATEFLLLDWR